MADQIILGMGLKTTNFEQGLSRASSASAAATKAIAAEQNSLFSAMDRLTAVQQKAQTARLANFQPEIILQREILGLKQTISNIEGTTVAKIEAQIILEQKLLQLEQMIASQKQAGGGAAGSVAGLAANASQATTALTGVAGVMGRMVSVGTVLKSALSAAGAAMIAPFAAEKIVQFLGYGEEVKAQWQELGVLSDQVAAKNRENNLARLTDEQKYQLALQTRGRLEASIAANTGATLKDQVKLQQDLLAYENLKGDIEKYERGLKEADRKAEAAWLEDIQKKEQARRDEDAKRRQEVYDRQIENDKRHSEFVDKNLELLTLESKIGHGITVEEKDRLDVLRLQNKELENQDQIKSLLSLNKRTPEEEALLQSLYRQNAALDTQIAAKTKIVATTQAQAGAEGDVAEAIGFATNQLKSYVAEWSGLQMAVKTVGRGDNQLSDRELQRKIRLMQADIAARQSASFQAPGDFSGSGYDPFLPSQQNAVQQAIEELRFRQNVRRDAAQLGNDAAFAKYNGLTEQRFAEIIQTATDNSTQTSLLRDIKQGLIDQKTAASESTIPGQLGKLTDATQAVAQQLNNLGLSTK